MQGAAGAVRRPEQPPIVLPVRIASTRLRTEPDQAVEVYVGRIQASIVEPALVIANEFG
jgi:hypothetical protein